MEGITPKATGESRSYGVGTLALTPQSAATVIGRTVQTALNIADIEKGLLQPIAVALSGIVSRGAESPLDRLIASANRFFPTQIGNRIVVASGFELLAGDGVENLQPSEELGSVIESYLNSLPENIGLRDSLEGIRNLLISGSTEITAAIGKLDPNLKPAALSLIMLAANLPSTQPAQQRPANAGVGSTGRPPAATAAPFNDQAQTERQETQEVKQPPKILVFGDSIASRLAGRPDVEGTTQTHEVAMDANGLSQVGAGPEAVLKILQSWENGAPGSIKGAKVVLSSGATNNPDAVAEYLPQMLEFLKRNGASSVQVLGVTNTPPGSTEVDGGAADAIRRNDTNAQITKIVSEFNSEEATSVEFTGGFEPGPDGFHPADPQELAKTIPSLVELYFQRLAKNEASMDAENENPTTENTTRTGETGSGLQAEKVLGGVSVRINPESQEANLSPEVKAFNAELERMLVEGDFDVTKLTELYGPVYSQAVAAGTFQVPEGLPNGYVKILLPNEIKGLLPQLTVAQKTAPVEMFVAPEMAAAVHFMSLRYSYTVAKDFPDLQGDMLRTRDGTSPNHKTHSRGGNLDFSASSGWEITDYSDGAALDYAFSERFNKDLTVALLTLAGLLNKGGAPLFSSVLFTGETVPGIVNEQLGRRFVINQPDHREHGHLTLSGDVVPPLPIWNPTAEQIGWGLEEDLRIGSEFVPLSPEQIEAAHGDMTDWVSGQEEAPATTTPETTTTVPEEEEAPATTTPETTTTVPEEILKKTPQEVAASISPEVRSQFEEDALPGIKEMESVYRAAEKRTGVPWEIMAAIHYREGSNDPATSIWAGEKLGAVNPDTDERMPSDPVENAVSASNHIIDMATSIYGVDLRSRKLTTEQLAKALLAYNRGGMYKNAGGNTGEDGQTIPPEGLGPEHSTYVVGGLTEDNTWYGAGHYGSGTDWGEPESRQGEVDARPGALTVYLLLLQTQGKIN